MTISCTNSLREGERPEYRYPLSAGRSRGGTALGSRRSRPSASGPEAPELVAEEVQRPGCALGRGPRPDLRHPCRLHQQREKQQAEAKRHQADDEEANRLRACAIAASVERPMTVQDEVVDHGDQPGDDSGDVVVDAERVHAERVDREVDHEPDAADDAEAHQLEPVGRTTHSVQEADVRPYLNGGGSPGHPPRVPAPG